MLSEFDTINSKRWERGKSVWYHRQNRIQPGALRGSFGFGATGDGSPILGGERGSVVSSNRRKRFFPHRRGKSSRFALDVGEGDERAGRRGLRV